MQSPRDVLNMSGVRGPREASIAPCQKCFKLPNGTQVNLDAKSPDPVARHTTHAPQMPRRLVWMLTLKLQCSLALLRVLKMVDLGERSADTARDLPCTRDSSTDVK